MQPHGVNAPAPTIAALLTEAIALHQNGKLHAASGLYQEILARSPRQFDALHLLGVIARQCGNPDLAVELIGEALGIDAAKPQAHCNLGAALQDLGRTDAALASYERALRLNPDYDIAHCNRGNTLRKLGRLDQALASYERALQLRAHYPEACCNRAMVLSELGRAEEALASAERALAGRANYPEALRARGNALQGLGRFDEALESYDRAIALKGDDAELWCSRGTALHRLQSFEAALQDYERAIALRPDYASAHHYRANSCLALGRRDEAIGAYRKALALGADAAQIGFALAALGQQPAPALAPAQYIKALFDQYAGHFDQHLVEVLGYQSPAFIGAALSRLGLAGPGDTLDLGCGTGLCGPYLKNMSRTLAGVDLSQKMLDKARERGLYDRLDCMDINAFLAPRADQFDLAVAADVFVYFGDLATPFALVHQALRAGGTFCFSVEACEGADFALGASKRYAHGLRYLQDLAATTGFVFVEAESRPLRTDHEQHVMGYIVLLQKPGA